MEKLAAQLADKIAKSTGADEERKSVIAYGLGALLQMAFLFVASLLFGLIFHCLVESMTIFWAVGLIKSSAGGAHSRTSTSCTCISLVSIFFMSLVTRFAVPVVPDYWPVYMAFSTASYALMMAIGYKRVPLASPNKPINRKEKIERLRKRCFITVSLMFACSVALIFLGKYDPRCINAALSLSIAILWQCFMLTNAAERFIAFCDSSFSA